MKRIVDLRSDTLSLPTEKMRRAIYEAELGDDQYGEDPTTRRLETLAAATVGKESALLVLSGTMGNLVAALVHTEPGDEVILDGQSHCYNAEVGGMARIAGLMMRPLQGGPNGLDPEDVQKAIRTARTTHRCRTGLIIVENTSNRGGGTIIPLSRLADLAAVAQQSNVPLHMDGARLFDAAVGLDVDARVITEHVDSVQFCLTKGLSAPLGSILAGSAEFIGRARRFRQMVGGGMRQAGIIAAAGIVALEEMSERLVEDHRHARMLAEGITQIDGLRLDLTTVQTNMVYVDFADLGLNGQQVTQLLAEHGVRAIATGPSVLRFVTYRGIEAGDIAYTLDVLHEVARSRTKRSHVGVEG